MYPVFIPIKSGGGTSLNKMDAILFLGLIGGLYGLYYYNKHPRIKITKMGSNLIMNIHKNSSFDFKIIKHNNTECLKKKGYDVHTNTNTIHYYYNIHHNLASVYNIIDDNKFREDCKSCNAYTSIYYRTPRLGTFPKENTKIIYWKDLKKNKEIDYN